MKTTLGAQVFFALMSLSLLSTHSLALSFRQGDSSHFVRSATHTADLQVYKISLSEDEVDTYLPAKLTMSVEAKRLPKLATHRHSFGLVLRGLRKMMVPRWSPEQEASATQFFSHLKMGQKYTYVVMPKKLVLTETCNEPREHFKDLASKHMLLSGLRKHVRFAGEMHLEHSKDGRLEVIFDNASGTYRPPSEGLGKLAQLLEVSLLKPTDNIRIAGRARSPTPNA